MRILIHLWMVLTLALGICGDDMVRREAEDITYEGSGAGLGQGSGTGKLPITGPSDDSDYSSSVAASMSYYSSDLEGSGSSYEDSYDDSEEDTNVIRVRGEFTISGIGRGNLDWMPDLADSTSKGYKEMANLIAPIIKNALQANKNTRNGLRSVKITGFRHGSIIVEYEARFDPDSTVSSDGARKSLKQAITNENFGNLMVDPKSVNADLIQPAGVILSTAKPPKDVTPQKPVKTTPQSSLIVTKSATTRTTTASNSIDERTQSMPGKPDAGSDNEVGTGEIDLDADPTEMENNGLDNNLGQKGNPEPDPVTNFWETLFSHPAILAGLVGAVVLFLLTVVLLLMFIIYRIKKKDEGSYSLDEPHKVKDPMAYWKDTKEFYA